MFSPDPGAETDYCRLALSLCDQVGLEHCLDLQEEEKGDQLSQETLAHLLTALHGQFSQAAPQPTSRPSLSGKDPGLGDSLCSLSSSQDREASPAPARTPVMDISHHRSYESLVRERFR